MEQHIDLANHSLPDTFELVVEGFPPEWVSFPSGNVLSIFTARSATALLRLEVPEDAAATRMRGKLVAMSQTQRDDLALKGELDPQKAVIAWAVLELEVLTPPQLSARLQPRHGTGFQVDYRLILRNRSPYEGYVTLQLAPGSNCKAHFSPQYLQLPSGAGREVAIRVGLISGLPRQERNGKAQRFQVVAQPQWLIYQTRTDMPPVIEEGEYTFRSRWEFLRRHPRLLAWLGALLLLFLSWQLLIFALQTVFLSRAETEIDFAYWKVEGSSLRLEGSAINKTLLEKSPAALFADMYVHLNERNQKIEIALRGKIPIFDTKNDFAVLRGRLIVENNELKFVADDPGQPNSFPWQLLPPDQMVKRLNPKLKNFASTQFRGQKLEQARIEGNTIYLIWKGAF